MLFLLRSLRSFVQFIQFNHNHNDETMKKPNH